MELAILYEDSDVVAVAKPAGLITHADGRTKEETAEDWFIARYGAGTVEEPKGYVHRLDRDTSGVLVFAKTPAAYAFLRKAFHDRNVHKTYLAFVHGVPKKKKGEIDFDIGRSRSDFRLRSAQPKAKGRLREALTHYEVLGEADGFGLMRVEPQTGRTHQIRVHLKAIHHPIVGDKLYAPNKNHNLGITRLGLHAYSIDLPLIAGARAHIIAPIPRDLLSALRVFTETKEEFALEKEA